MDSTMLNDEEEAEISNQFESTLDETGREQSFDPEPMEMEENDQIDNDETESHEDSPSPSDNRSKKTPPSKRKKRKRSSSFDSNIDSDENLKVRRPLANTNKSINVGDEFQAAIPDDIDPNHSDDEDSDERLWVTPEDIDEKGLVNFVKEASDRYRVPIDRALWILTKENFDFDAAIKEIAQRKYIKDVWTDEEIRTFHSVYTMMGKHFVVLRQMLPHRSHTSIVQYYYEHKKRITYDKFVEANFQEDDIHEETESNRPLFPSWLFSSTCENCGEQAERMQVNEAMRRAECKACLNYFQKAGFPRPTSLRMVVNERFLSTVGCPEAMSPFMNDYDKLSRKATGITYAKRKLGDDQTVEDIIGVNRTPPPELEDETRMETEIHINKVCGVSNGYLSETNRENFKENENGMEVNEELNESTSSGAHYDELPPVISPAVSLVCSSSSAVFETASHLTPQHSVSPSQEENMLEEAPVLERSQSRSCEGEIFEAGTSMSFNSSLREVHTELSEASSPGYGKVRSESPEEQRRSEECPRESSVLISKSERQSTSMTPEPYNGTTPSIWQKTKTVCMEEIDVLADDSRRKLFNASLSLSRVNMKEIAKWRSEMEGLNQRMDRMHKDADLLPSVLKSGERVRAASQEWTECEIEDTLRCFQWYGKNFKHVSDVIGTKTVQQVVELYKDHHDLVATLKQDYDQEMSQKIASKPVLVRKNH